MTLTRKKNKVKDDERIKAIIEKIKVITNGIPENSDMPHEALLQYRDDLHKLIELLDNRLKKIKSTLPQ